MHSSSTGSLTTTIPEPAHRSSNQHETIELSWMNAEPGKSRQDDIAVLEHELPQSPETEQTRGATNDYFLRRRQTRSPDSPGEVIDESRALMYGTETNHDKFPDGGLQANIVLFGSFIGLIADFGIANALGAIESYISLHQLAGVPKSTLGWIFSLHLGCMYFFGVFFGELFDKFGAKPPLIAGTLIMALGLFCTAEATTMYQFILAFSLVTALGTLVAMCALIGSLSHWFLKKRGTACSIATIGGLVGSAWFTMMLNKLYDSIGFKNAIRVLASICFFLMAIATALVRDRRSVLNVPTEETEEKTSLWEKIPKFFKGCLDFSVVKDMKFVSLCLAVFLSEVISMTTLTYLGSYAIYFGLPDTTSFLMLTLVNVCGIPSRLLSGLLADKYGRFNVMCVCSLTTTIVIFALWYPSSISNYQTTVNLLYAFSVLFGISTSSVISLIPACTGQICSSDTFGKVYGTMYFFLGFLTILGMYLATLVIADGHRDNFGNFVLFEGGLSALNVLVWIWARYSAVGFKWCKF
ncbi:putative transporter MCH4 [Candida viswanathii]|uniref:Putative transporter MCH4 n=1 Tax=Candida viswanathii TaxID=5486 RepID=A0A367XLK4_9ASCO|nr:putative transporter MCH4 [Candida viswanathii]